MSEVNGNVAVRGRPSEWNDSQVEMIKLHWPAGRLSASQIGKIIDKSRNAVIGKAHRLGLEGRPHGVNQHRHADGTEKQKLTTPRRAKKPPQDTTMAIKARPPTPFTPEALLNKKPPIAIGELTEFTCRAPNGCDEAGVMTYCGNSTFMGKSFCEGHCAMFYVAPSAYRRSRPRW